MYLFVVMRVSTGVQGMVGSSASPVIVAVSLPTWVLGNPFRSSARSAGILNQRAFAATPVLMFNESSIYSFSLSHNLSVITVEQK